MIEVGGRVVRMAIEGLGNLLDFVDSPVGDVLIAVFRLEYPLSMIGTILTIRFRTGREIDGRSSRGSNSSPDPLQIELAPSE